MSSGIGMPNLLSETQAGLFVRRANPQLLPDDLRIVGRYSRNPDERHAGLFQCRFDRSVAALGLRSDAEDVSLVCLFVSLVEAPNKTK
jgi:hypothetical protein